MQTVPLSRAHDRSGFRCGQEVLDTYLQRFALQNRRANVAASFVLLADDGKTIVGFYTLAACAIELVSLPPEVQKKLPAYDEVPGTLLGRLAVNQAFRGKGNGKKLLLDAFERALRSSVEIASALFIVDAKDDAAAAFYRASEFKELTGVQRRFFIPMAQVAQILKLAGGA